MSQAPTRSGSQNALLGETVLVPLDRLIPNTWNVNHLNAFGFAKLCESIEEFGFVDPLLARAHPERAGFLQIIGGKHRWDAAKTLVGKMPELAELPVIVRALTDVQAKKLSLIDNELHGQADPLELSELLRDLRAETGADELLRSLPYTEDILSGFLGLGDLELHDPAAQPTPPALTPSGAEEGAAWVERTYRMPADIAVVVDDAIRKARGEFPGQEVRDFQALEVIAAEYLAS